MSITDRTPVLTPGFIIWSLFATIISFGTGFAYMSLNSGPLTTPIAMAGTLVTLGALSAAWFLIHGIFE